MLFNERKLISVVRFVPRLLLLRIFNDESLPTLAFQEFFEGCVVDGISIGR